MGECDYIAVAIPMSAMAGLHSNRCMLITVLLLHVPGHIGEVSQILPGL